MVSALAEIIFLCSSMKLHRRHAAKALLASLAEKMKEDDIAQQSGAKYIFENSKEKLKKYSWFFLYYCIYYKKERGVAYVADS